MIFPRRLLIVPLLASPIILASQAPPATGVIAGRVVDGVTGQAIAGAAVRLGRPPAVPGQPATPSAPLPLYSVETSENGQFVFARVAAGSYTIFTQFSGYIAGEHGQQRIEGPTRPVTLVDGQRLIDLTIRMWRQAAIVGMVRDEAGEPVIDVRVRALRQMSVAGQRRFVWASDATTDDRGMYRLRRLRPGQYVVAVPSTLTAIPAASGAAMLAAYRSGTSSNDIMATYGASPDASSLLVGNWLLQRPMYSPAPPRTPTDGSIVMYPATFSPAAISPAEATVVQVQPGDERLGVDVQLRAVETFRVSGTVTGSDGRPTRAGLRLVPLAMREADTDGEFAAAITGSDDMGHFTFLGVPPGQYVVTFQRIPEPKTESLRGVAIEYGGGIGVEGGRSVAPPVTTPLSWAETAVTVAGAHLEDVSVVVREGSHLRGTIEFRGAGPRPTATQVQRVSITLTRADGRPAPRQSPSTQVDEAGRFLTSQYLPGRYALSAASMPPGWTLRSAIVAGRDLLETPLELTGADVNDIALVFSTGRPVLSGTVRQPAGTAGSESTVLVFPEDYRSWIAGGMLPTRARAVSVGRDGAFGVTGLRPGAYLAVAVGPTVNAQLQDPSSVTALARGATAVRVGEDGATTVSLAVTAVSP
jgi:hypothetical protein